MNVGGIVIAGAARAASPVADRCREPWRAVGVRRGRLAGRRRAARGLARASGRPRLRAPPARHVFARLRDGLGPTEWSKTARPGSLADVDARSPISPAATRRSRTRSSSARSTALRAAGVRRRDRSRSGARRPTRCSPSADRGGVRDARTPPAAAPAARSLRPTPRAAAPRAARLPAHARHGAAAARRAARGARCGSSSTSSRRSCCGDCCARRGIRHVHVHFANVVGRRRAARDRVRSRRSRRPWTWSFTMHGPTEFYDVAAHRLAEKVADARFVVCISDFARSQLMALLPSAAHWDKLRVVHCGVDPAAFAPVDAPRAAAADSRSSASAGSCRTRARPCCSRRSARCARRAATCALTLVGDGPARAALERRRRARLGIARRVGSPAPSARTRSAPLYARRRRLLPAELRRGRPGRR